MGIYLKVLEMEMISLSVKKASKAEHGSQADTLL